MRIIAGSARGRKLEAPADQAIRPTLDRTRQAVFNRLCQPGADRVQGATLLDAFAGTGAFGLEALSRGAAQAIFWDVSSAALAIVRRNAAHLGLADRALIAAENATTAHKAAAPVDIIFLDPPYGEGLLAPAITALVAGGWAHADTLIIAESDAKAPAPLGSRAAVIDQRRSGPAMITFAAPAP